MSNKALIAGHAVKAVIPTDFEQVMKFAKIAIHAGMFKDAKEDEALAQAAMAVLQGLEVGIPPMQAIQQIAVINGRCTIWGDLVPALIWRAGHKIKEWIEGEGDARVAYCEITRSDNGATIKRKFSVGDAKTACLWETSATDKYGKPNRSPWFRYQDRMLQMRARGFCARDGVPDVLRGLYITEELEDERRAAEAKDITPASETDFFPPPAPEEDPQVAPEPEKQEVPIVADDFIGDLDVSLSACKDEDGLHEVWAENLETICAFGQERRMKAETVFESHISRVTGQTSLLGAM